MVFPIMKPESPSEEKQDENEIEVKKQNSTKTKRSKKRNYEISKNVIFCNISCNYFNRQNAKRYF